MSYKLTAEALKIKTGSPMIKLVLMALCDYANDKGECWPSYQTIANDCEISRRSTIDQINALVDMGIIKKKKKRNNSNVFKISLKGCKTFTSAGDSLVQEVHQRGAAGSLVASEGGSPKPISIEPIKNQPVDQLLEIPDFIDKELWNSYLEVRKKKKATDTAYAIKLIINKLITFEGQNPGDANKSLEESVMSGWKGVFPLKQNKSNGNNQQQGQFSNDFSQYGI